MKYTNLQQIIDRSVEFEEASAEFYGKASEITSNEKAKMMLRALCSQERKHAKLLKDFDIEQYKQQRMYYKPDFSSQEIFKDCRIKKTDSPAQVQRKALSFKKKIHNFYCRFAQLVKEENIAEFFEALSNLELQHIEIIQRELAAYYR